ncbi:glycosyl hydrolase family 28-related protein [uncultured Sulfitobacter sp.]|uniref:glycosyl hydrolase family 28-related protein n=1 Tax=uncultured Sulfitobacter sp. TaxID=191468 RepID=UPI0026164D2D|nr:glycosyl hydrolase family 28-related protein [uncultured Sulfitobacter sp.]
MSNATINGAALMPAPYADGLDVYSRGNGTPGTDTYQSAPNAAFVPADQDFGGALEIFKSETVTRLRFMGQTPLEPGCYLRITARVKAVSGTLPLVRIAGYPAQGNGSVVPDVLQNAPPIQLTSYGEVVEISAIVGAGARDGVDMVWGTDAVYGHFGIDLSGPNGGIVRVDDLVIEDVTAAFRGEVLATVDVVDYGAIGDGTTDNTAAFEAANIAAEGRTILVPDGVFRLNGDVTIDTDIRFVGHVTMPTAAVLLLRCNFDLPNYIDAFEDEELAFLKAFQALLNNSDHETLDLKGRKVNVTAPLDMQAAVPDRTSYATRRVVRGGQLEAANSAAWDTEEVTSQATYSPGDARTLSNVTNVANVPVGALVEGTGVGREVYVRAKNVALQEVTLSAPLFDAAGTQNFTFRKFQYLIDFSGFTQLGKFVMADMEFQCNDRCSGIMLAQTGSTFHVRDSFISRPADRGITSIGTGCQGMFIDRCQFLSAEDALPVANRRTIGFNTNANDVKVRDNRATRFRHFGLLAGANNLILGNHFFQGDAIAGGIRSAGLILCAQHTSSIVSGNYVDNCFIEWTNEQDPAPEFNTEFSFSALSITDNVFLSGDVAPWFSYLVVKPHGVGHFLSGVLITGNRFRSINGTIDRVDRVDTTFADLDIARCKNVVMTGNSYHGVTAQVETPAHIEFTQNTESNAWQIDASDYLPFGGQALKVDSITPMGGIRNANNVRQYDMPYVDVARGADRRSIQVVWPSDVRGSVMAVVRMDAR